MTVPAFTAPTAATLRRRALGILAAGGFGAFWATAALEAWPGAYAGMARATCGVILLALIAAACHLLRIARHGELPPDAPLAGRHRTRYRFLGIFAVEIIAIVLAASLLGPRRAPWLMPVIAVIVGLHFVPLAPLFDAPHYRVTATAMTLAGLGGIAALALGISGSLADAVVDGCCALTLWITCCVSWWRARRTLGSL